MILFPLKYHISHAKAESLKNSTLGLWDPMRVSV